MRTNELDYELPERLIALRPPPERGGSRMLVVHSTQVEERRVSEWPDLLPTGALVVVNDTAVLKARLLGRKRGSGGRVELLLIRCLEPGSPGPNPNDQVWEALGRASKGLRPGMLLDFGELSAEIVGCRDGGTVSVRLRAEGGIHSALERVGHVPIPPYLNRADDAEDSVRYQTVYARVLGSVAAPTAGLHLTEAALLRLQERGVEVAAVTLHVGMGTFRPVAVDDLDQHPMHSEWLAISPALADAVSRARQRGAPIIAVGTTVVRALESGRDADRMGQVCPGIRETELLIQPGYQFSVVDGLLTNFHQPRSTLLALVFAFAGTARVRAAYRLAIQSGFQFLSYGDAMWLPQRLP